MLIPAYGATGANIIAIKEAQNYGKILYRPIHQQHFPKRLKGGGIPLILPPWICPWPLAISCKNHRRGLAHFSHLASLILLFFTKRQSQMGRTGGGGSTTSLLLIQKYAPDSTLLSVANTNLTLLHYRSYQY